LPVIAALLDQLARHRDRPVVRAPDLAFGAEETPPWTQLASLALQQAALQAVYLVLPALIGAAFGRSPSEIVSFLCLSIVTMALTALTQTLTRGPIGSGYALPSIPAPAFVGAYLLAADHGVGLGGAGALMLIAGLCGAIFGALVPRLQALVPTEVAGVVVLLIGISLLPRAYAAAAGDPAVAATAVVAPEFVAFACLAVMMAFSLARGALARFAVLWGGGLGCIVCIALGLVDPEAREQIAAQPWLALPTPVLPDFAAFDPGLLPAFLITLLASLASWSGDLIALQRAGDGKWRRPDPTPIRRGMVAQSLGFALAGLIGSVPPSSSSACVGLAIATRTLSRRVPIAAAGLLLALACCPKLVELVVLLPDPVKAAMLFHVCCFMIAAGCRLVTARMLDERRTFAVGLGLAAGVGAMIVPDLFARTLHVAFAAPVSAGAMVAIVINLATLRLVVRRAAFTIPVGPDLQQALSDRLEALGGAWGARQATIDAAQHALIELAELLAMRGHAAIAVQAQYDEDFVTIAVRFPGDALPPPSAQPDIADLEGALAAQEAFALWMATRRAERHEQTRLGDGSNELRLTFAD
jgi:NCS2 family nucleobase:cation symporter-2